MARRLEQLGATALAMPCNTAHHYVQAIKQATTIPFLNMVDLSVAQAAQSLIPGGRIGFLASPAVRKAKVFTPALDRAGVTELWPEDMDRLLETIRLIKAQGPAPEALQALTQVGHELDQAGADMLFIACSEFSLLAQDLQTPLPVVDTLDVLARAIFKHTQTQEVSP